MSSHAQQQDAAAHQSNVANSTKDNDSTAPLVHDAAGTEYNTDGKRRSWLSKMTHHHHHDKGEEKTRKSSISDSGPYVFAFDPKQGKEVLVKNPHWPNEDSWKREDGEWAMGSMMGAQGKDFGGTVG